MYKTEKELDGATSVGAELAGCGQKGRPTSPNDKSLSRRVGKLQLAAFWMAAAVWCGSLASGQNCAGNKVPPAAPPVSDSDPSSLESLLETKVVTASRFSENLADAPGVMTVVGREEIERFGGLTLREILNRVSGLNLASNTFTDRSIVTVRGDQAKDTGAHVLFLINGRPTREVVQGGIMTELLEAFPVGILERIEVIEGPGSVLYGSNAFSGVINLITRKRDADAASLRGFGTGAGPSGGSGEAWFRRGDFSVSGAAQFHQDSPWTTPVWPDLGGGLIVPPQPYTLFERSRSVFAEAEYRGFSAMVAAMDWRAPYETFGSIGSAHWSRSFADLGYDVKPGAHWDMGIHLTYTGTGLDSTAFPITDLRGGETELNWTNSIAVNQRTRITFGALYDYQRGRNIDTLSGFTFTATDISRSSAGLYAQLEYRLVDGLNVIGGFQTNKVENIPVRTVPRVGLMWNPYSHWHVKALYGQAFRAPSLDEIRIQYPALIGNPSLLPEISSTFDLGVIYQARRLQTSIDYYRSQQTNDIEAVAIGAGPGGLNINQYQNAGGLLFQGFQAETKWYLTSRLFAVASALYQTNRASNGKAEQLPVPDFSAKAGLSYADAQGWTIGLFDVYSGAAPGFDATPNGEPGPRHLLAANLRLNLEQYLGAAAKRVALFAHGDNLMNRPVWQPAWGFGSASTLPVERGRTIYYGVEFSFKRE